MTILPAYFTTCFTIAWPLLLIWQLHRRSAFWRRVRLNRLAIGLWLLMLLPACQIAAGALLAAAQVQPYMMEMLDVPYAEEIGQAALSNGLDPALLAALVEVESGFNKNAVGAAGEVGLTQLMPMTAIMLNVADRTDAMQNLDGGARYLRMMLDRYDRLDLALAAYNAGPGRVDACSCIPGNRRYVSAVAAAYGRYRPSYSQMYSVNYGGTKK